MILKLYSRWPWEKNTDYQNQNPNQNQRKKQKPTTSCLFIFGDVYVQSFHTVSNIHLTESSNSSPHDIPDENQDLKNISITLKASPASEKPITIIIKAYQTNTG